MLSEKEENIGCIVGAVVHLTVEPAGSADVERLLQSDEHIEIHAKDGRQLVITIEASTSKAVMKLSEDIQNMDGVLQITPVYQHSEDNKNDKQDGGWRWR